MEKKTRSTRRGEIYETLLHTPGPAPLAFFSLTAATRAALKLPALSRFLTGCFPRFPPAAVLPAGFGTIWNDEIS